MKSVVIVYFSETGSTHRLAEAIEAGCLSIAATSVVLHRISGEEIDRGRFRNENCLRSIDHADGLILGSPTYMGGPAAQFKAFADATSDRWDSQQWSGKLASGFTVGSNPNGDQLATLQYFSLLAAQHGMLWVGLDIAAGYDDQGRNTLGSQLGLATHCVTGKTGNSDTETAMYLGARVARLCAKR